MERDRALKNLIGSASAALLAATAGMTLGDYYAEQLKADIEAAKKALEQ